jgi:DNA repair ATPase RecN
MAASPREQITKLIRDVEKAARQMRKDVEKRAKAAPKNLQQLASRLRKLAEMLRKSGVDVAAQVEKYVHDLRMSLEGAAKSAVKTASRATKPKRKAAPKRKTPTKRRKRAA